MKHESRGRFLHVLYGIGLWFKGIDGILELIGGVLLLVVNRAAIKGLVATLTQHELSEDPTDWVAVHVRQAVSHLSSNTKAFAGAYLLGHGAIKAFLVWGGLLRGKRWAFPTAMVLLAAFICYQVYRIIHRFSIGLLCFTSIDMVVVLLIWREYRLQKRGD